MLDMWFHPSMKHRRLKSPVLGISMLPLGYIFLFAYMQDREGEWTPNLSWLLRIVSQKDIPENETKEPKKLLQRNLPCSFLDSFWNTRSGLAIYIYIQYMIVIFTIYNMISHIYIYIYVFYVYIYDIYIYMWLYMFMNIWFSMVVNISPSIQYQ